MEPRGATELQMEMLQKYVSKDILDQVQICTSIPGKVPIDPNKLKIVEEQEKPKADTPKPLETKPPEIPKQTGGSIPLPMK